MKRFAQCVWLVVLALWLPCTMHCSLEAAGILLSNCCVHSDGTVSSQDSDTHDPCRDCHTCSVIESGGYVKHDGSVEVKSPPTVFWWIVQAEFLTPLPVIRVSLPRAIPPPELPPSWRFSERAALMPRAPSSLS